MKAVQSSSHQHLSVHHVGVADSKLRSLICSRKRFRFAAALQAQTHISTSEKQGEISLF